jgi:hypothetical protein
VPSPALWAEWPLPQLTLAFAILAPGATTWSLVVDACGAGACVDALRAGDSRSSAQPAVVADSRASVASAVRGTRGAAGWLLGSIMAASIDLPGNESTTAG